jgi:hypothetical protein
MPRKVGQQESISAMRDFIYVISAEVDGSWKTLGSCGTHRDSAILLRRMTFGNLGLTLGQCGSFAHIVIGSFGTTPTWEIF